MSHRPIQEYITDAYGLKAVIDVAMYTAVKSVYWEARGREITQEGVAYREIVRIAYHELNTNMWSEKQAINGKYAMQKAAEAIEYYDTDRPNKAADADNAEDEAILDIRKAFAESGVEDLIVHARAQLARMKVPYKQYEKEIEDALFRKPSCLDWGDIWSIPGTEPLKLKIMLAIGESLAMGSAITSEAQMKYLQAYNQNAFGKMMRCAESLKELREDVKEYHDSHLDEIGDAVVKGRFPVFELERLGRFLGLGKDEVQEEGAEQQAA